MREWAVNQAYQNGPPVSREGGLFYINSNTAISEIVDGTSQTVMISELRTTVHPEDMRGVMHYPEGSVYHRNYTPNSLVPDQTRAARCHGNDPRVPCVGVFTAFNNRRMVMTARSYHPGGVNVTMADASVRFVTETINLEIWQALSTPRAGLHFDEVIVGSF